MVHKKLSYRLENGASTARISFHHNTTRKHLAVYLGFLQVTFWLVRISA